MGLKKIILFVFLYSLSWVYGQTYDFSGEWNGFLLQESGGVRPKYVFQMSLIQEGDRIKGASYLQLPDRKDVFATIKLKGTVTKNAFTFEEYEILKEKALPNMQFCIKKGTLYLTQENGKNILKGAWTGTSGFGVCSPGTIELSKPIPKPIVVEVPKDPIVTNPNNTNTNTNPTNNTTVTQTVKDTLVSLPMDIKKGEKITLKHIYFKPSSSELLPNSMPEMQKILQYMRANPTLGIQIQGHTDIGSTAEYNLQLSTDRAKTVSNWLEHYGIKAERLSYKGFGSTKPIADNNTPQGRKLNRRIEFEVTSE